MSLFEADERESGIVTGTTFILEGVLGASRKKAFSLDEIQSSIRKKVIDVARDMRSWFTIDVLAPTHATSTINQVKQRKGEATPFLYQTKSDDRKYMESLGKDLRRSCQKIQFLQIVFCRASCHYDRPRRLQNRNEKWLHSPC